jgi:predicted DNA-binding transcriptional regulator AlpA
MKRDTREQASRVGFAGKTFDNWRSAGRGPPYYKVGGRVLYDDAEVDAWLSGYRVDPAARKERIA